MKIYLDDWRPAPDGWTQTLTAQDTIAALARGGVTDLSLDHDLGDDANGTGYDVLLWIEESVHLRGFDPPRIAIHSSNASARVKMELAVEAIRRLVDSRERP